MKNIIGYLSDDKEKHILHEILSIFENRGLNVKFKSGKNLNFE